MKEGWTHGDSDLDLFVFGSHPFILNDFIRMVPNELFILNDVI